MMQVRPIVMEGRVARLEPLSEVHIQGLQAIGLDPEIWRHMPYGDMDKMEDVERWVREILEQARQGISVPFAVIQRASGRVAGCTRYMDIRPAHRGLEIGGTWYGAEFRRTAINTETKYLLLRHAFEDLQCIRVQLKTDARNERSQRAIERIGAMREGTLRNHMILPGGTVRHSVYYSILDTEWPKVKRRLEQMLSQ